MLGDRERALHARQILLPEIGLWGQAVLCDAVLALAPDADPAAADWTRTYLERAGLQVLAPDADPGEAFVVAVADGDALAGLAGDPVLGHAAAALAGCLSAVEGIKAVLGVGQAESPAAGLQLGQPACAQTSATEPAAPDESVSRPAAGPAPKKETR